MYGRHTAQTADPLYHPLTSFMDHRRHFINPLKKLQIGPFLINCNILHTLSNELPYKERVSILYSDLDHKNKQNQAATLKYVRVRRVGWRLFAFVPLYPYFLDLIVLNFYCHTGWQTSAWTRRRVRSLP